MPSKNKNQKFSTSAILERLRQKDIVIADSLYKHDLDILTHELDVYHAEIMAQNDELQERMKALEQAHKELSLLFERSPIAYVLLDKTLHVLRANTKAKTLLKIPVHTGEASTFASRFPPGSVRAFVEWLNGMNKEETFVVNLLTANGRRVCSMHFESWDTEEAAPVYLVSIEDIQEQRDLQEALQQQKDTLASNAMQLETILQNVPDLLWIKDTDGVYITCNRRFEDFVGADKASIIGHTDDDLFDADVAKSFQEHDQNALNSDTALSNFEEITFGCDAHKEYVQTTKTKVLDANGAVFGVLGIGRDMTQIKATESDLKQAQKMSKLGSWRLDLLENKLTWSDEIYNIFEIDPHQFDATYEAFIEAVHPEDRKAVNHAYTQSLKSKAPYEITHRLLMKDGRVKWVVERSETLYSESGDPMTSLGTIQDVTQSKILQDTVQTQNAQLQSIYAKSRDGIALVDLETRFVTVNPAYAAMTGFSEAELLQRSCIDMSVPDDVPRAKQAIAHVMQKGFIDNFEKSCYRKDGTLVSVSMSIVLMPDGNHLLITVKDISKEVHLRDELVASKESAESASRAKAQFLANMSHEIRTPMTGILGFVERLAKDETDPQKSKQFEMIKSSGQTLMQVINDILDFSKIESNRLEIEESAFNLEAMLHDMHAIYSQLARAKNITVTSKMDEGIPTHVMGDVTRLKQVIFNLMNNALKFTHEGGTITLEAAYDELKSSLSVSVSDTGIGIGKENLNRIFEAFSQEDSATTRRFGGTGLGLTISSQLVTLMGGTLRVESVVNQGSRFFFDLPLALSDENEEHALSGETVSDRDGFSGKVLIVEDNKTNQMLLGMILDDHDVSYDVVSDGAEAVLRNKNNHYDLILMDENMPIMNGMEATACIREAERERGEHVSIVAVTANAMSHDKERFLEAGMDAYISKPYSEEDVLEVLQHYLR